MSHLWDASPRLTTMDLDVEIALQNSDREVIANYSDDILVTFDLKCDPYLLFISHSNSVGLWYVVYFGNPMTSS